MSSRLGPLAITCDAPPFPIVQACETLAFQAPGDVRWCRMSQFLKGRKEPIRLPGFHLWSWFFGTSQPREKTCTCGQSLPPLDWYTFTLASGKEVHYLLGQCRRCRTMYWDQLAARTPRPSNEAER